MTANRNTNIERDSIIFGDLSNLARLIAKQNPQQEEVRLYAATVRRLLVDCGGLLSAAASAKGIKLEFCPVDSKPLERESRNGRCVFFALADVSLFGVAFSGMQISQGNESGGNDYHPDRRVNLRLESFLKQPVMYYRGEMLTRHNILDYVANKAGGVHYDSRSTMRLAKGKMTALELVRRQINIGTEAGAIVINMAPGLAKPDDSSAFKYEPKRIDGVYLEFLSTAALISNSPSVQALLSKIQVDLDR